MQFWRMIQRWLFQDPEMAAASGDGRGAMVAAPTYNAENALSSIAAFPWVYACTQAIVTDLAGLPLIAVRDLPNGQKEIVRDHPVLDLLKRPHPQCSGARMRRQLYADFVLSGEAVLRRIETSAGEVLTRLHPVDVSPEIDPRSGLILFYQWGNEKLDPAEVLYIADIGWIRGIRASRGTSPIQSLESGLMAAQDARNHARKAAKRGRLEMLLRPSDVRTQFGKSGVEAVKETYTAAARAGDGVLVLNRALEATPLSMSPKELEFSQLATDVRDETLAALGVPPVRVGLPGANYGTAKQQTRIYWERLRHTASLFDDEFSRLTGDGTRIEHDFTNVEALQTSYTERQMRASVWVTGFGVPPADAAAYEGFHDAPIPGATAAEDMRAPRRPGTSTEEPRERDLTVAGVIEFWLMGARERFASQAAEGSILPASEMWEAGRLEQSLTACGVDRERASRIAANAAAIVTESVSQYVASAGTDAVVGLGSLRVFSSRFAAALAEVA